MTQKFLRLLVLASAASTYVTASPTEVTLVMPFLGSTTAVPAEVLGVDSQGHTTYAVVLDGGEGGGPLTATLVDGPDEVFITAVVPDIETLGVDCALQNGNAICTDLDSNSKPETETVAASDLSTFVLDVTATATNTATSGSGSSTPSAGGSSSSAAQPSKTGSAMRNTVSTCVAGGLAGMLAAVQYLFM